MHLFSQSRGKLRFEPVDRSLSVPRSARRGRCARRARRGEQAYDLAACLAEGFAAGAAAAGRVSDRGFSASATLTGFEPAGPLPTDDDPKRLKAFVDFQNDVTAKDIKLATREGFESIEHVKRYTTTGMATDQGKTSNMNALGLIARTMEKPIPEVGTTTFRPPYTPVSFGALVGPSRGALFDPVRKTPIHGWAAEHGALFENVSLWRRAWYFPKAGEDIHAAVARESKAAREAVGLFDGSTLGKIEVVGPDAAEFMNRMYVNSWTKLEPGRCRYGLMLKEDGYILDDGVVARLAPDRFHVTTTTGGAARVLNHMEDYLQTEWPYLNVFLTSTTEQWAVIAVQGPKARDVIRPLIEGVDLSNEAFPHMAVRVCSFLGAPCRLFRVSFSGELGYEINVPADFGRSVWEAVYESGRRFGITPYGTEAMHVLRAERGFIIVGQETDGTVTPDDLGLGGMIAKAKPDFVGKRSLARPDLVAPRPQAWLVGLLTDDPRLTLDEGAQVVAYTRRSSRTNADARPCHIELLECELRSFDRAGRRCGRAQPRRSQASCDDAGRFRSRHGQRAGLLRSQGRARSWLRRLAISAARRGGGQSKRRPSCGRACHDPGPCRPRRAFRCACRCSGRRGARRGRRLSVGDRNQLLRRQGRALGHAARPERMAARRPGGPRRYDRRGDHVGA